MEEREPRDLEQRVSDLEGQVRQITRRLNQREPLRDQLFLIIFGAVVLSVLGVIGTMFVQWITG